MLFRPGSSSHFQAPGAWEPPPRAALPPCPYPPLLPARSPGARPPPPHTHTSVRVCTSTVGLPPRPGASGHALPPRRPAPAAQRCPPLSGVAPLSSNSQSGGTVQQGTLPSCEGRQWVIPPRRCCSTCSPFAHPRRGGSRPRHHARTPSPHSSATSQPACPWPVAHPSGSPTRCRRPHSLRLLSSDATVLEKLRSHCAPHSPTPPAPLRAPQKSRTCPSHHSTVTVGPQYSASTVRYDGGDGTSVRVTKVTPGGATTPAAASDAAVSASSAAAGAK